MILCQKKKKKENKRDKKKEIRSFDFLLIFVCVFVSIFPFRSQKNLDSPTKTTTGILCLKKRDFDHFRRKKKKGYNRYPAQGNNLRKSTTTSTTIKVHQKHNCHYQGLQKMDFLEYKRLQRLKASPTSTMSTKVVSLFSSSYSGILLYRK